jgi:hypothetical protein
MTADVPVSASHVPAAAAIIESRLTRLSCAAEIAQASCASIRPAPSQKAHI